MGFHHKTGAWAAALLMLLWRRTCRYRLLEDPRPPLRAGGRPYVFALLHAHQVAAVFANDEPRLAAMVSRSPDGDLLAPSLKLRGVEALRGSTRTSATDKGGLDALARLAGRVAGGTPGLLAVDGPRGPRGHVQRGIAELALRTRATVLPLLVLPSRRWLLTRTWDRFQLPQPFCTIRVVFGPPVEAAPDLGAEALRATVAERLAALERRWDPAEASG